jgi:hypothetical protein
MGVDEHSGRGRQLHMYLLTWLAWLNNGAIKTDGLTRSGCRTLSLPSLTVTKGFTPDQLCIEAAYDNSQPQVHGVRRVAGESIWSNRAL